MNWSAAAPCRGAFKWQWRAGVLAAITPPPPKVPKCVPVAPGEGESRPGPNSGPCRPRKTDEGAGYRDASWGDWWRGGDGRASIVSGRAAGRFSSSRNGDQVSRGQKSGSRGVARAEPIECGDCSSNEVAGSGAAPFLRLTLGHRSTQLEPVAPHAVNHNPRSRSGVEDYSWTLCQSQITVWTVIQKTGRGPRYR